MENLFIGDDLNGHVGINHNEFDCIGGEFDFV